MAVSPTYILFDAGLRFDQSSRRSVSMLATCPFHRLEVHTNQKASDSDIEIESHYFCILAPLPRESGHQTAPGGDGCHWVTWVACRSGAPCLRRAFSLQPPSYQARPSRQDYKRWQSVEDRRKIDWICGSTRDAAPVDPLRRRTGHIRDAGRLITSERRNRTHP